MDGTRWTRYMMVQKLPGDPGGKGVSFVLDGVVCWVSFLGRRGERKRRREGWKGWDSRWRKGERERWERIGFEMEERREGKGKERRK